MPFSVGNSARISSNTPAASHLKALRDSTALLNKHQLNLSTGKQINNASDDIANYPTSRILQSRNSTLQSASQAVADAGNVVNIILESLDNIADLITEIKDSTAQAASGIQGTDEKIALSKAAYRLASQIQTIVDSSVFGGRSLIDGTFSANFVISVNASNSLQTLSIDMGTAKVKILGKVNKNILVINSCEIPLSILLTIFNIIPNINTKVRTKSEEKKTIKRFFRI